MTDVITVIGDLVEDVVVWSGGPMRRGTDNPSVVTHCRGGSAANVAVHAARLAPTRFIGRVGMDAVAERLVDGMVAAGVDVRVQRHGRTGTVVVLVEASDGERTMFPDRGAAAELGAVDVEWLRGTTVLHVPAYGLVTEPGASSISDAIDEVRTAGGAVSMDLSAVTLIEAIGTDHMTALLDRIRPDVVFANADEARAFEMHGLPPSGSVLVVKDGPRPARVVTVEGTVEVDAVTVDEVLDTTGAGDAFAAGFLASWIHHRDPVEACRDAHQVAASVLTTVGAG